MSYPTNNDSAMKRQLLEHPRWRSDAGEKTSYGLAVGYNERDSAPKALSIPRRTSTPPKHKSSHLRFLTWLAYYRKSYLDVGNPTPNVCPVNECHTPPFGTEAEMLQHVGNCPELYKGTYHCLNCDEDEKISKYHGNSCLQSTLSFQKVRRSLRSATRRLNPHEPRKHRHSDEPVDSGPVFSRHHAELASDPIVRELPSYHPSNFMSEMESPVSTPTDGWYRYHFMGNNVGNSAPLEHYPTTAHHAFQQTTMDQHSHHDPEYPEFVEKNHFQRSEIMDSGHNQNLMKTSAGIHGAPASYSMTQAKQVAPEWHMPSSSLHAADSMITTDESQAPWRMSTNAFNYGNTVCERPHHEDQYQTPANSPIRPYASRNSVSSMGDFSTGQSASRTSSVSTIDATSWSRNTSGSDQDITHASQAQNHHDHVFIFDAGAMLCDEPEQEFFPEEFENCEIRNAPSIDPQPPRLSVDIAEQIDWQDLYKIAQQDVPEPASHDVQTQSQSQPQHLAQDNQPPCALTDAKTSSPEQVYALPKGPTPLRRRGKATPRSSKSSSTSICPAEPRSRSTGKPKMTYECRCRKIQLVSNKTRHDRNCRAQAPSLKERKEFKCHYKNCRNSGFTRSDNLKKHQIDKGHLMSTVEMEVKFEISGQAQRLQEWRDASYMAFRGSGIDV